MYQRWSFHLVNYFLPHYAELLFLEDNYEKPAIITSDLDGDDTDEVIAAYKLQGQNYILILKNCCSKWQVAANIKGSGYAISYLNSVPITSSKKNNLIVGWQVGAIWYQLNIFDLAASGFIDIAPNEGYYSKIEIEDMPSKNDKDNKYEVALWMHDTDEAYRIEVFRWDYGKPCKAKDVYPYYFKKVVKYYESKSSENPESAFYWYYLADSQLKACEPEKALTSINRALNLETLYPSKEELSNLKRNILSNLQKRSIELFPASIKTIGGTKFGYIGKLGDFKIKPNYDYAKEFQSNDLAIIQIKNFYGAINPSGEYVVEPKYESIAEFSEGRASVMTGKGFGIIDENGTLITNKNYSFIGNFSEGRVIYSTTDSKDNFIYGYLDKSAREIIPARYENANDFKEEKALVQVSDKEYALINLNGQILNIYRYDSVGIPGDGLLAYEDNLESKYGYINEMGEVIIEPKFTIALPFNDDRAIVNISENYTNKYGLIDIRGNFVIKPIFNDVISIGERRFAVGKVIDNKNPKYGVKYAIADSDGNFLTKFIFNNIADYKYNLASVYDDKYTYFVDDTGKRVESLPRVEGTGNLSIEGELIKAYVDNRLSYMDKSGNIIWIQNSIIPLNKRFNVIEEKYKPNKDFLAYYPQITSITEKNILESINSKLKNLSKVKPVISNIQLESSYLGDFNIEFFKKNLLVLELYSYDFPFGAAHGIQSKVYPHINLKTGKFYELKDLFKKSRDYVRILSNLIEEQIKNNKDYSYVFPYSYKGIKSDQSFYLDDNNLYIFFNPYEIAPYAAGFPTFKIPFSDINNIIDTKGELWRAFHHK